MFLRINRKREERLMKSFGWIVIYSLAIFLVATSTSRAQEVSAPPATCADGSIGACVGEILEEQLSMIVELDGMMRDMQTMNLFSLGQGRFGLVAQGPDMQGDLSDRIASLKRRHGRAVDVMKVTTDDEINEMIAQADMEKGKNCKFSDINFFNSVLDANGNPDPTLLGLKSIPTPSKFGNGKCDIFDAVNLDDDTVKVNERRENMCEKVCEEKMVGGQGQMGKSKERLIGDFIEALGATQGALQSLSAQRARMSELGLLLADYRLSQANSRLSITASGPNDPCVSEPSPPGIDYIAIEILVAIEVAFDVAIVALDIGAEILEAINDIAEKPCLQVVAGFNGSTACIPLITIFHIAKGITTVVTGLKIVTQVAKNIIEIAVKIDDATKTDDHKDCIKIIRDDTVKLQGDVTGLIAAAGETSAALAELQAEMALIKSLLEETRDLLLTPPGRRVGFQRGP